MNKATVTIAAILLGGSLAPHLAAQPAVEELERKLRQEMQPPVGAPAPLAQPTAPQPAQGGYLGLLADDREDRGRGVRILQVYPGGPAEAAGLQPKDLIVAAGGTRVRTMGELSQRLSQTRPDDKLLVEVLRDAQWVGVEVTLGRRPPKPAAPGPQAPAEPMPESLVPAQPSPPGPTLQPPEAAEPSRIEALERRVKALEERLDRLERLFQQNQGADARKAHGQISIGSGGAGFGFGTE